MKQNLFDVVVVGGGHAGCEAAAAAARMGARAVLVTHRRDRLGATSCNPAIGGVGKGQLVCEIDALDGLMGQIADHSGIQFHLLNRSGGPAVWGPRAQIDRDLYRLNMQERLANTANLSIHEGEVIDLLAPNGLVSGVILADGEALRGKTVILTTGTFLRGEIHIGHQSWSAGRDGDPASLLLAERIASYGLSVGRLKTGTPPRIDAGSIDWHETTEQTGDAEPWPFSFLTEAIDREGRSCFETATTEQVHDHVRSFIGDTAVYGGAITDKGPRYCPSIEDKVVRFPERKNHRIILEPEGLHSPVIYPNGLSTSLPEQRQREMVRMIKGLRRAELIKPGYAIAYDFIDPRCLLHSLECRETPNLFLAGQINGTTGYEEAAAQGLVAGMNAARKAGCLPPVIFDRAQAYIGVLIDDLVSRGVGGEPYRMFTSRAEYRILLRSDNADRRLTGIGIEIGVVGAQRASRFADKMAQLQEVQALTERLVATPSLLQANGIDTGRRDGRRRNCYALLGWKNMDRKKLCSIWPEIADIDPAILDLLSFDSLYKPYEKQIEKEALAMRREQNFTLPEAMDFSQVPGLSNEVIERLTEARPKNITAASFLPGITPASLGALMIHVGNRSEKDQIS